MKKILLIVALIAGSYELKAQTLVKPMDSLLLRSPQFFKNISPDDTSRFKKYFVMPPTQDNKSLSALLPKGNTELFASRMPVAKVHSDDHMPVAKAGSDDHMPEAKVKVIDPLKKSSVVSP